MRSIVIRSAALTALLLAAPSTASAALTASHVRVGAQPGYVRVVVDFTGGALQLDEANADDPGPADGDSRVQISHPGIAVVAADVRAHGVRARLSRPAAGRARILLTSAAGMFKYVRVSALHGPERLVIDLYRRTPPSSTAAEIRVGTNRCLTLDSVARNGTRFAVKGTELDLFEGSFVLRVRDARGRVVGQRVVTARGAWERSVGYSVSSAQPGTVEAVAASAKDGSLACLVQVRVALVP
ncbi:MAG: Immunoglobulin-like domain of bacterial spore germination [Solirubrobacteraceae bacterium]|nr:Immunoglobulin-like domain of bacterial spore germination [Solirubrobacteraceae bacterium]